MRSMMTTTMMMMVMMTIMYMMKITILIFSRHGVGNRELKQLRRRPQRQLQKKTIGLMIKTTALHVHHAF